jgi:hypothetical protein
MLGGALCQVCGMGPKSNVYGSLVSGMSSKARGRGDRRGYDRDRLRGPRGVESATQPAGYVLGQALQFF